MNHNHSLQIRVSETHPSLLPIPVPASSPSVVTSARPYLWSDEDGDEAETNDRRAIVKRDRNASWAEWGSTAHCASVVDLEAALPFKQSKGGLYAYNGTEL